MRAKEMMKPEELEKTVGGTNEEKKEDRWENGINLDYCTGCGACTGVCPMMCIRIEGYEAHIDKNACVQCGSCANICPVGAIDSDRM